MRVLVVLVLAFSIAASAQDTRIPIKNTEDRYHYASLVYKRQWQLKTAEVMRLQFAQLQRDAAALDAETTETLNAILSMREQLFQQHELTETEFDINAEAGVFERKTQ